MVRLSAYTEVNNQKSKIKNQKLIAFQINLSRVIYKGFSIYYYGSYSVKRQPEKLSAAN